MNIVLSLGIPTATFFTVFVLQIILHRVLLFRQRISLKTLVLYPLGLLVLVCFRSGGFAEIPVFSMILYCAWSVIVSVLYLTVFLSGETPVTMILNAFTRKRSYTEQQLIALFSEDKLLWKRLDDLIVSGLVAVRQKRFMVTAKGFGMARFFQIYQALLHSSQTG